MPYFGTGANHADSYGFRSVMVPNIVGCWDMRRKDLDYDFLRRLVAEWRSTADLLFGDFYPLTSYSVENVVWLAWQFHRPDLGKGMVQAFRRSESPYESARFFLLGLEPNTLYRIWSADSPQIDRSVSGTELMETGLELSMHSKPEALLILYERVDE
jgi:alpha-galactosidase